MIYLTLPCQAVGKLFDGLCTGLSKVCNGGCEACNNGCKSIGDCISPITRMPLGGYVIGSWLTMAFVIGSSGMTVTEIKGVKCEDSKMFCYINIGLGVVHAVMAYYVQWRILKQVRDAGGDPGHASQREVAQAAKHVALYDIAFCLYIFAFLGSFGYNCYGLSTLEECEGTGGGWSAGAVMILYGFFVGNYFFCFYCCSCCGGGGPTKSGTQPPATQIGSVPGVPPA
jgi:hypothetical protein